MLGDYGERTLTPDACLSLRGLAALVLQCPDLSILTTAVRITSAIPDCSDLHQRGRANTHLTELLVGASSTFNADEVAAFLASVLANLEIINFHETLDDNDSEESGKECDGDYEDNQNACKNCVMELLPCYVASKRKQVEQGERWDDGANDKTTEGLLGCASFGRLKSTHVRFILIKLEMVT
jgi:hypothetical protein